MSTPNEYAHSHSFHPDNVSSLVIQAAHTHTNYNTAPTTSNAAAAAAHFGGGSFFPNTIGYDVTMLPFFSHGTQRPAHFNASSPSSFSPQKHSPENQTKNEQLAQITAGNGRTDSFNVDAANSQAIYWSRQSQLSPFGVLPHEISPNQVTEEKSSYENALNAHFVAQSLSNLNQTQDKTTAQAVIMSKLKETNAKKPHQFAPKSINEIKQAYGQDEVNNYRNGVVNHNISHTIAKSFKGKNENEALMSNETLNTVPRDYRVFKSSEIFTTHPVAQTPAVKYATKGSKQYLQQKQMIVAGKHSNNATLMKTQQRSSQGLPVMQQQKMGDFHDSQSSPISLTSNDINEHHRYSSTPESMHVATSAIGNSNYHDIPDPNCHNVVDKAKVTSSFLKLPYSVASAPNNTIADAGQTNHKTSYAPLYVVYNNLIAQKRAEKQLEPSETLIPHTDTSHSNMTSKSTQNSAVGYSSVIMRTDRIYETDEKDKLTRRMAWPNTNDNRAKTDKLHIVQTPQQPVPTNHQQLLLGLTERQHSYFDTSPCQQQMQSMSVTAAAAKCSPKEAPNHQQMVQSQEQMTAYQQQQYNTSLSKTTMTQVNQMTAMQQETEKPFSRKRKASSKNNAMQEYQNRDPPPAHLNVYQQPLQNSSYYDMSKMYPNNEQFYQQQQQQQNVSNYHQQQQQQQQPHQQQQSVIASLTRSSPSSNNQQMRQMSMASATMPLSAYFSSFQSTSPQCSHPEYSLSSTEYCSSSQEAPSCAESNSQQLEKEVCIGGTKVIVPNIEEEFSFLFDPRLPHYKEIASVTEDEEQMKSLASTNKFYRRNADFLASYRKFLDNNCESVESLADGAPTIAKSWNRNKIYQPPPPPPTVKEKEETVKPTVKEPECSSFENDIRYYPLPKSSKERRLSDSSSDDESDCMWPELTPTNKKTTAVASSKKEKKEPKEVKIVQRNRESKKGDKEMKTVKMKLDKLEKAKRKIEKLKTLNLPPEKLTSKLEKAQAEANAIRESVMIQKKKPTKDLSKNKVEAVPRRKLAERKAKDGIINRLHGALGSEDELRSSSDSDPSWTPHDDDDDSTTKRRSIRIRPTRTRTKRKSSEYGSKHKIRYASDTNEKDTSENETVRSKTKRTSRDSSEQTGHFFMLKTSSSTKPPSLWRLKNDRLQKFELLEQNGRQQFGSVPVIVKLSEINLTKYEKVDVVFVDKKKDRLIVQLCDKTDVPINTKLLENFMNETSNYENQFHVYTQTLISQALDSNFLSEVVKENDDYFLSNMKAIDDVTTTYETHLTSVIKWATTPIETVVKTWPFVSIETTTQNNKTESATVCASCRETNVKQTAVFYGQPYERDTLQNRETNSIPNNSDKTINLCEICVRDVKLFNKIWHQKYHAFVECAKYVSKKKSEEKKTKTTDILNDLLADGSWLAKLFYDIRMVWLQISIVKKRAEER